MTLTLEEFTYGFVNTFSEETAASAYERYAVPETGQIFYEAGFANFHLHPPTEVHFKHEDRAPLLIVGATDDKTVPASLSKAQFKRYERSPAKTDYLEFERAGRTCTWPPPIGRRSRSRSTAGSTACSTRPSLQPTRLHRPRAVAFVRLSAADLNVREERRWTSG